VVLAKGKSEQPLAITLFDSHYTFGRGPTPPPSSHRSRKEREQEKQEVANHPTTVFVGNLGDEVTEEGLKDVFESKCGKVAGVKVVRDKHTNQPKGFALVQFESEESMPKAMALPEEDPEALKPHAKASKGRGYLKVKVSTSRYPAIMPSKPAPEEAAGGGGGGGAAKETDKGPVPKKSTTPLLFAPPRALARRPQGKPGRLDLGGASKPPPPPSQATAGDSSSTSQAEPSSKGDSAMSNADFKALFLKPK